MVIDGEHRCANRVGLSLRNLAVHVSNPRLDVSALWLCLFCSVTAWAQDPADAERFDGQLFAPTIAGEPLLQTVRGYAPVRARRDTGAYRTKGDDMKADRFIVLGAAAMLGTACSKPPPAPESLNDAVRYMFREFYSADPEFQAGVQGFMNWYDEEGREIADVQASLDTAYKYSLEPLTMDDIAHLPLDEQILLDAKEEIMGERDPSRAIGVISVGTMDCDWKTAEEYLVREDQDAIFNGDWEAYEREYLSSKDTFLEASQAETFDRIDEPIDPWVDGYDDDVYAATILRTVNQVDPSKVLTSDIEAYELNLDLRHGLFRVSDRDDVGALAILTYNKGAAWGSAGNDGLVQSYSIELNVETEEGQTMRMLAVYAQAESSATDTDGALAYTYAVNKSLKSSERMSEVCSGAVDVSSE